MAVLELMALELRLDSADRVRLSCHGLCFYVLCL